MELVAGLVLLAGLVVSLLLAAGRQQRLHTLAEDRLAAVTVADYLLASWYASPQGVPLSASGVITGHQDWYWRTSVGSQQSVFGLQAAVVILEIVRRGMSREVVLLRLESLVPIH